MIRFVGEGENKGKYVVIASGKFGAENIGEATVSGSGRLELNETNLKIDQTISKEGDGSGVRFNFGKGAKSLEVNVAQMSIGIGEQELKSSAVI